MINHLAHIFGVAVNFLPQVMVVSNGRLVFDNRIRFLGLKLAQFCSIVSIN